MNHSDNIDELEAKLARQNAEFAEIKADIAKDIAYLVENFDLLTNKWGDYYFEKYSKEYPDRLKFADIFRSDIQWYIDYLSKKHT